MPFPLIDTGAGCLISGSSQEIGLNAHTIDIAGSKS